MYKGKVLLPDLHELPQFLEVESCSPDYGSIFSSMMDPLKEILSVNGKRIRFEMVEIGFFCAGGVLSSQTRRQLDTCEEIIEGIHLGSMVIDDIEDQSEVRRGKPTLHLRHGLAVALNVGNWLYFRAVELIHCLGLDDERELSLRRSLNQILLKAHFGQGVDVGIDMRSVPVGDVESTYLTAAELKTGALMAFAFHLGSIVASKKGQQSPLLKHAKSFGIALQMLDDIGNFLAPPPKGREDLKIARPSFIWVMAARVADPSSYDEFKLATRALPDPTLVDLWSERHNLVPKSKHMASEYLMKTRDGLLQAHPAIPTEILTRIISIFTKLEHAYE